MEGWVISTDEENYTHGEFYGTKEDAIGAAPEELALEPGETFYVGYAKAEAERLAQLNPGQEFFVLKLVGVARKIDAIWTDMDPELPF